MKLSIYWIINLYFVMLLINFSFWIVISFSPCNILPLPSLVREVLLLYYKYHSLYTPSFHVPSFSFLSSPVIYIYLTHLYEPYESNDQRTQTVSFSSVRNLITHSCLINLLAISAAHRYFIQEVYFI